MQHTHSTKRSASSIFAFFIVAALWLAQTSRSEADPHTAGVPELNSRPGAAFTIYLDVAGFNYTGMWGGLTPGNTLAVNDRAAGDTFTAAEQDQIKIMWSRLAQSYVGFNVNVTTVDPAVAAGQAATDLARQNFYDATPNLMHTIVGSGLRNSVPWQGAEADGLSGLGIFAGDTANGTSGDHTNWMFSENQAGATTGGVINGNYIGAVSAHENAHAFGLNHQGDWTGNTLVNEYSLGDAAGDATTPGTYVPIIGQADGKQRITWRVGDANDGGTRVTINDVQSMLAISNIATAAAAGRNGAADLHLINDGIGHSLATATPLALNADGTVDFNLATGVVVPLSEANPLALGAANYTQDWFRFTLADTATITLTANDGTQFLTAGVADGVGTLRSTLSIYEFDGDLLGTALEDASTLLETYSNTLPAGTYYAAVGSFGGHAQVSPTFNAASYFDMGAFFLTGSGFAIPEPGTLSFLIVGACLFLHRRHRRA